MECYLNILAQVNQNTSHHNQMKTSKLEAVQMLKYYPYQMQIQPRLHHLTIIMNHIQNQLIHREYNHHTVRQAKL